MTDDSIASPLLATATPLHLHLKLPRAQEVSLLMALAAERTSSSVAEVPSEIVVQNKAGAATLRPIAVTTVFLTLELADLPVTSPSTANVAPMARSA